MLPSPRPTRLEAKRRAILGHLFRERQASRLALARALNLNASMVGGYVDAMIEEGLLVEDHAGGTRRGRTPVPIRLNPAHGCFLGVDFEALKARAVLTDFVGEPLYRKEIVFPLGTRREKLLEATVRLARAAARKAGRRRILSAGVAAPGQVDVGSGRVVRYALMPDFVDVPVREIFERALGRPVILEDNLRTMTLGEMTRGSGRGLRNVLCLTVRSGMGLGIVLDGKLHRGVADRAGVVGFSWFPGAGGPRRMTDLAAATGIVRDALELARANGRTSARRALLSRGPRATLDDVVRAAEGGDDALARTLSEAGRTLGLFLANLGNTFAPEKVILAGEVPVCSPLLRAPLDEAWAAYLLPELQAGVRLEDSRLEGYGAALGAAFWGFPGQLL